jgi:hypothetical protein
MGVVRRLLGGQLRFEDFGNIISYYLLSSIISARSGTLFQIG